MKGIILAAGVSSRLRPLTNSTPKCLLELGGQTILERSLNSLLANGIEHILIVTGYLEHMLRDYVSSRFPNLMVRYVYNTNYQLNNNIYSLWMTKDLLANDEFVLLDSDIVFDKGIVRSLLLTGHENCLALRKVEHMGKEEIKVKVDECGRILAISKEVNPKEAAGESIGIEKFSGMAVNKLFEVLERKILKENNINEFYEAAFQEAIAGGLEMFAVDVGQYRCIEIDTAEDLEEARSEVIPYLT